MTPATLTAYRVWMHRARMWRLRAAALRLRMRSVGCPPIHRIRALCPDVIARVAECDRAAARAYEAAARLRDGVAA